MPANGKVMGGIPDLLQKQQFRRPPRKGSGFERPGTKCDPLHIARAPVGIAVLIPCLGYGRKVEKIAPASIFQCFGNAG